MKGILILGFLLFGSALTETDFLFRQNAVEHHTDKFHMHEKNLILRRGQHFTFKVPVQDSDELTFKLVLKYKRHTSSPSTLSIPDDIVVPILKNRTEEIDKNIWSGVLVKLDNETVIVRIEIPVTNTIGLYDLNLEIENNFGKRTDFLEDVYILFNPWNEDDQVYLPGEAKRREYVLNDVGKVYLGSSGYYSDKQWIFGQYEDSVLPAVMYLLDQNGFDLNATMRADVTTLSRVLSSLVNANDGFGVIAGRWDGNYFGGRDPSSWSSSVEILEQYHRGNGRAVMYGQCWVFAAVLTTVCRTLGIPARPITTFASAHDTDDSLTIDTFVGKDGEEMDFGSDSVWNFHAWTEAWFARHDVPKQFGGWQVIDSTPQELSDGLFQTGPASVAAVKKGDVNDPFDLHFVFSEVSSATVHWKEDSSEPLGWKKVMTSTFENGDLIVTKKIGPVTSGKDVENVTSTYKFDDEKERSIVLIKAAMKAGVDVLFWETTPSDSDVKFVLQPLPKTMIGDDLKILLSVQNFKNETVDVRSIVRVDSTFYTGITAARIKKTVEEFSLNGTESREIEVHIPFEEYYDKLVEHNLLHIFADSIVSPTNEIWTDETDFAFKMPSLQVEQIGKVSEQNFARFKISLKNPLKINLRNGKIEARGVRKYFEFSINTIHPLEEVTYEAEVSLGRNNMVIFAFNSDQLTDIRGSVTVNRTL